MHEVNALRWILLSLLHNALLIVQTVPGTYQMAVFVEGHALCWMSNSWRGSAQKGFEHVNTLHQIDWGIEWNCTYGNPSSRREHTKSSQTSSALQKNAWKYWITLPQVKAVDELMLTISTADGMKNLHTNQWIVPWKTTIETLLQRKLPSSNHCSHFSVPNAYHTKVRAGPLGPKFRNTNFLSVNHLLLCDCDTNWLTRHANSTKEYENLCLQCNIKIRALPPQSSNEELLSTSNNIHSCCKNPPLSNNRNVYSFSQGAWKQLRTWQRSPSSQETKDPPLIQKVHPHVLVCIPTPQVLSSFPYD